MNEILLCETKPANKPYYFRDFRQTIETYEEVCYIISKRMIYFFVYGIPEDLKVWMQEEFRLRFKSSDLKKQLEEIISLHSFFTKAEKQRLMEEMRGMYLQSPSKKQWLLGENFRRHKQYLSAYHAYEKALLSSGHFSKEERADIYYHMGYCLSKMFQFERAKTCFRFGLELGHHKKCQNGFFLMLYLQGKDEFVEAAIKEGVSKEEAMRAYETLSIQSDQVMMGQEEKANHRNITGILEQWKNEYKKEIS